MQKNLTSRWLALAACLVSWMTVGAVDGLRAQELEIGGTVLGTTGMGEATTYRLRLESAGVLTVVVRSTDDTDLVLSVTDGDGQPLPDGESDQDLGGHSGAEQVAVTIPRAGTYHVRVRPYSSGKAGFRIGASWLAFPDLEQPADPDGAPSSAIVMRVGQESRHDSINSTAGDHWDWFVVQIDQAGMLTVATRADEGDLVIEAFNEGEFSEAAERSDQDLQGTAGNEAITLTVQAGQTMYFKVSAFSSFSDTIRYRLSLGFMPD
ncbi:MAG: PPC domain-containing protein [Gemmatimonadetes bacterium]|nr:PPC domain-containing protein [Gemmatimonadota bacterium]